MIESIAINKAEFLKALEITEIAEYILDFERSYIEVVSLDQLRGEIRDYPYPEIKYTDDISFDVMTMADFLSLYNVPYDINEAL